MSGIVKIYLAHPITYAKRGLEKWRREFKRTVGGIFIKAGLHVKIYDPGFYGLDNFHDWREIVSKNTREIANSDYVVAYVDQPSFGVMSEIIIAYNMTIPIIGYSSKGYVSQSPWIKRYVEVILDDEEEIAKEMLPKPAHKKRR